MADLEMIRAYCRILPDEPDDPILKLCYDAAIEYMEGAGVSPLQDSPLYDLGICMLAGTWYDARGTLIIGQVPAELERSIQAIILQLRYQGEAGT